MLGLSIVEKAIVAVVGLTVLAGAYYTWRDHQRSIGASRERILVEKSNAQAKTTADKFDSALTACDGVFDYWTGKCTGTRSGIRPVTGGSAR